MKYLSILFLIVSGVCQAQDSIRFQSIDTSSFVPISNSSNWKNIHWNKKFSYIELVFKGNEDSSVVLKGNQKNSDEIEKTKSATENGFGTYCPPGYCIAYFIAVDSKGKVHVINKEGLLTQLVPVVQNEADAVFFTQFIYTGGSPGFPFSENLLKGQIKKTSGGYLIITNRITSDCPVTYSDLLISVNQKGKTRIEDKKVTRETGICF